MNEAYNMDCMEYMKTLPDNAFDLAVVDPPYGINAESFNREGQGGLERPHREKEGRAVEQWRRKTKE